MLNDTTPRTLPLHIKVVAIDETEDFKDAMGNTFWPEVKEIRSVYLYDQNEVTYCCEITPSYALYYIETYVLFNDPDLDDGDNQRFESIRSEVEDVSRWNDRVMYVHCREADKIEGRVFNPETVSFDDVSEQEQLDSWIEYASSNSLI